MRRRAQCLLLCLDRGGDVGGVLSEMGLYLLATVTHDHDEMFRVKSASRSDRPRQHWPTSNLVQQLRLRRLHASPPPAANTMTAATPSISARSVDGLGVTVLPQVRMWHARFTLAATRLHRTAGAGSTSSPGRSRTCVAHPDSKSGGPCRQTNRGTLGEPSPHNLRACIAIRPRSDAQ